MGWSPESFTHVAVRSPGSPVSKVTDFWAVRNELLANWNSEALIVTFGFQLPADSLPIVLGLLLRFFRGLLGVGIGLQLMDSSVQALSFIAVRDLAA